MFSRSYKLISVINIAKGVVIFLGVAIGSFIGHLSASYIFIILPALLFWRYGFSDRRIVNLFFGVFSHYAFTRKDISNIYNKNTIADLRNAIHGVYKNCKLSNFDWRQYFVQKTNPHIELSILLGSPARVFIVKTGNDSTIAQQKSFILPTGTSLIFMESPDGEFNHFQQFQLFHELAHTSVYATGFLKEAVKNAYHALFVFIIVTHLYYGVLNFYVVVIITIILILSFSVNIYLARLSKEFHEMIADLVAIQTFALCHTPKYEVRTEKLKFVDLGTEANLQKLELLSEGRIFYSESEIVNHIKNNHQELEPYAEEIAIQCKILGLDAVQYLLKQIINFRSTRPSSLYKKHLQKLEQAHTISKNADTVEQFIQGSLESISNMTPFVILNFSRIVITR